MILMELWPAVSTGSAEILFIKNARTAFRACAYSAQHLVIAENMNISPAARQNLIQTFGARELKKSLKISFDRIKQSELRQLVEIIREGVS